VRTKVIAERVAALERVIDALAVELIESTDEELLQAAKDLGMDPTMRGSAAFIGIKYPVVRQFSDFFESPVSPPEQIRTERGSQALPSSSTRPGGRKRRSEPPDGGNDSD
jgi:hypothetical protein